VTVCMMSGCEGNCTEDEELQDLLQQMVASRTPDKLPTGGTHAAVRGDGRCLIGAVQHGAAGYADYSSVPRDSYGVPLDLATADAEQRNSDQLLTRCYSHC
jgi:hypothetical protein